VQHLGLDPSGERGRVTQGLLRAARIVETFAARLRGPARSAAVTLATRVARARWRLAGLAWGLWALAILGLAAVPWLDHLLRHAGRLDLVQWTAEDLTYALLGLVSAATVGAVGASRRSRHPVGWLLLAFGLVVVASLVARGYLAYGLLARLGALPAAGVAVVAHVPWLFRRPGPPTGPGPAVDPDRVAALLPLAVGG
jgi:hypothetical protein